MGLIRCCDHCLLVAKDELVPVLGLEVCETCAEETKRWILRKTHDYPKNRARVGEPWDVITALIEEHGHVTPALYAARTGLTKGRKAYFALRPFIKQGRLESDRLGDGTTAYFLCERREAAE